MNSDAASVIVLSGLGIFASLGLMGWWMSPSSRQRSQWQALLAVTVAVTLVLAAQRHGATGIDVLGLVLVATALLPLWRWSSSPPASAQQFSTDLISDRE